MSEAVVTDVELQHAVVFLQETNIESTHAHKDTSSTKLFFSGTISLSLPNQTKLRCFYQGRRSGYESRGDGIHVNPERSFGGTNGEPPSEASQLRKGGPGALPRKISKTYMANGAIYVIPELYIVNIISLYCNKTCINYASFITIKSIG